jgi:hypothetical protein
MPIPRYASAEKRAELVTAAKLLLHEQGLRSRFGGDLGP